MLLKRGVTCEDAIKFLNRLKNEDLLRVQNALPHSSQPQYGDLMSAALRKYDDWTLAAAREMHQHFVDQTIANRVRGHKYALILTGDPRSPRTAQLIYAELSELQTTLMDLANQMLELREQYKHHQGKSLVLDTNDLLHYQRLDKIPWSRIYGRGTRVVIPHVVIDEIDRKSFAESPKIQKRARGVYRVLEKLIGEIEADGQATLFDGSHIEVLADEPGHQRLSNNDEEIIIRASFLRQAIAPNEVVVVTRDHGMRTRAKTWKLKASKLPDKYLIPEDKLSAADLESATESIGVDVNEQP